MVAERRLCFVCSFLFTTNPLEEIQMKINQKTKPVTVLNHEGLSVQKTSSLKELKRAVFSCLLWENNFYENGENVADRIKNLVKICKDQDCVEIANHARNTYHLRHVPLMVIVGLLEKGSGKAAENAIVHSIKRADEISELVAIWWKDGKRPIPNAMKRGLAKVFNNFNRYQFGKYNGQRAIRLRDVMFMVHPKPKNMEQAQLFKDLANDTLESPDTWEVALSGGADKKETFERLIREGNLGYLALLRNLRNMTQAGCDNRLIKEAILAKGNGADKVLPFRFIAAARASMNFVPELDKALCENINHLPKLSGKTIVLVDVSGSMDYPLSGKSDITRMDAAAGLASVLNCEDLRVFSFSERVIEVPPYRGLAGIDAVIKSQGHSGTYLGKALQYINDNVKYDRIIVITDEQSADRVGNPTGKGYMINVASYQNGVNYGNWTKIDGFSENVIRFIYEYESNN